MISIFVYNEVAYILEDGKIQSSAQYSLENLYLIGDFINIFIYKEQLTTDFVTNLNFQQLEYGLFYSIHIIGLEKNKNYRKINSSSEYSMFIRKFNSEIKNDLEINIFTRHDSTISNFRQSVGNESNVLSMLIDGSNWRIHLNDGMILGIKNQDINSIYKYPTHVQDAIKNGNNVIYPQDINIAHIFLNSCSDSLTDKNWYGSNINVAYNLLHHNPSVISSYRMKTGNEKENLLHYLLIKNGLKIEEIHFILNVYSYLYLDDFAPYINFGNIENSYESLPMSDLSFKEISIGEYFISAIDEEVNKCYFEVEIPMNEDILKKILNKDLKIVAEKQNGDFNFCAVPYIKKKLLKVFLFNFESIRNPKVKIKIVDKSYLLPSDILKMKYDNLENLKYAGFNQPKLKKRIESLQQFILSKIATIDDLLIDSQYNKETINKILIEEQGFFGLNETIIIDALKLGLPIERFHNKSKLSNLSLRTQKSYTCPNCGEAIFIKISKEKISDSNRASGICRLCHNVFDLPFNKSINELKFLPKIIKRENGITFFEFTVRNSSNKKNSYFVFINPTTDYSSNIEDISIEIRENNKSFFTLLPNESKNYKISLDRRFSEQEVNKFVDLNIYIFENFNLSYFSQKINFPSTSIFPNFLELKRDIDEYLLNYMSQKRRNHSYNVADKAIELAKHYGENIYEAEIAALLHDSGKEIDENHKANLFHHNIQIEHLTFKLPHAHISKEIAEKIFKIDNVQILDAIIWHTTGRPNMTGLEKIIFVADFISKDRSFDNKKEIEEIAYKNLDEAIGEIMNYFITHICKVNNISPDITEEKCRDYYYKKRR